MTLTDLSAAEAIGKIENGELSSAEYVAACLERIDECEDIVQAWQYLDPDLALVQARERDQRPGSGLPLLGVPVGIKDIIDTSDMPTECGTPLLVGRQPDEDASLVALLRAAGAVIMGKTVTTEFACFDPSPTRNPWNLDHTPGGSSSGSAAAGQ